MGTGCWVYCIAGGLFEILIFVVYVILLMTLFVWASLNYNLLLVLHQVWHHSVVVVLHSLISSLYPFHPLHIYIYHCEYLYGFEFFVFLNLLLVKFVFVPSSEYSIGSVCTNLIL